MSSIYKLSICGVRSFDPEGSETIQFGFPLTLICGQNGCGKTTIIECLKYATTGDLPPNSKGGAFVHDPKLAYKSEVRAQVKLAFSNANGKSMICTRSMQLAKKRGRGANGGGDNTTFKTLEGQLAIMNKGERSTISTKNAELDAQVPLYLGASKAVLDYVIFCHQDDSLWPLSEASILKKRFDDIFEALKFTKVLDNLKVIRKDMTTDIKLIEQSVEHFKIDKERANKIKNKLDNMKVVMNTYTEDITDLTRRLEEYEAKADKLFSSNQQFQQVLSKLQQLRMSQKSYQDQILRLKLSVDEILPDSDSELMNQLSNFDTILEGKKSEIGGLNTQLGELEKSLINMRLQHNKAIGLEGSLRAKEEVYRADLIERSRIIDTHKEIVKSNSQGTDGDDEQIAFAFSSGLSSILESSRSTFQLIKDENKSKEKILGDEVKKVENSIVTFQQQLKHIQRDIIDSKAQIEVNSTKISSMLYNEGNLEIAKSEVYNLLEKFQQMKNENELSKFQVKINEGNSQITKIEVEIDEINKKVGAANKQSDLHAKLSLLNESKQEKESSLNQLVSFHKSNFEKEVGEALQVETCDSAIGNKIQKIEQQIKDLTLVIDQEKETYNNSNNSLQSNLGKLGVLEALLSNLRLKIFDVIDEDQLDTYEILINDLESDYRDALDALNTIEVTKQFNIKAIDIAEKEKLCSLCYRPFSSPELTKFVDLLKEKVSKMNAETLTSEFEQSKCDLESAKSIGSDVIQYRKSIEELSQLKQEINSLEPKVSEQKDLYDTYIALFNELKLKSSKLTTLQRPMSDIIRITQEIKNLNTQINDFKESLEDNDTQGGSGHSVSELQSIQQLKNQEIKAIRTMINENLDAKYAKQRELSRFENNIKDKQIAVSDLEKSLLDKKNLITTLENLEIKISKWQDESQQIEFELIEFEEKKAVESLNLTELLLENRKTEGELQEKISTFESILKDFQRLNTSIQKFQTGV